MMRPKIKILFVFNKLTNDQGGLITSTLPIIQHLVDENRIDASIVCLSSDKSLIAHYLDENIPIITFPAINLLSYSWSNKAKIWLNNCIKNYDLVHIHGIYHFLGDTAQKYAKQQNVPYIISFHGMLTPFALKHKQWKKRLYHVWFRTQERYRNAKYLHALSEAERQDIDNFMNDRYQCNGYNRRKGAVNNAKHAVFVVSNGVDLSIFKPMNRSDSKGALQFLFAGRLDKVKQYQLVIDSFIHFIKQSSQKHRLIVAGYASDKVQSILLDSISNNQMESTVEYVGVVSQYEMARLMQQTDVFVSASKSEAFSMSIVEAMACGCVCITANNHSFDIVNNDSMVLLEHPINQNDLVSAYENTVNDPEFRQQISENAIKLVANQFAIERIANQMLKYYRQSVF